MNLGVHCRLSTENFPPVCGACISRQGQQSGQVRLFLFPYNNFFSIFRYTSQTKLMFVEQACYLLWPRVGDALHLALVLLRPDSKCQGAVTKAAGSMNTFPSACLF